MKKLVSVLLVLAMCASLAACGGKDGPEPTGSGASSTPAPTGVTPAGKDNSGPADSGNDVSSTTEPTDEQLKTLTEAYNQVAALYNDVATTAEGNGWVADEQTFAAIQTIGSILDPIGQALAGNLSDLEGSDFDALPGALLALMPDLQKLAEDVFAPYGSGSGTGVVTGDDFYGNYSVFQAGDFNLFTALSPAEELTQTIWEFAGGFAGGKEMGDAEANAVLETYGGVLQLIFLDAQNANLVQGGETMAGTYRVLDDEYTLNFAFDLGGTTYSYVGVFNQVKKEFMGHQYSEYVLLLVSPAEPETVLYMHQMDER